MLLAVALIGAGRPVPLMAAMPVEPGCEGFQAWTSQSNPRSDSTGLKNSAYPEANATYWATQLTGTPETMVTIHGRYPLARYMSFQVYDNNRNVLDSLNDVTINPDSGQNNPYRTGTAQGTYTVQLIFGRKPAKPRANTIYTAGLATAALVYRIYYSNNPEDLSGSTPLPSITVDGVRADVVPTPADHRSGRRDCVGPSRQRRLSRSQAIERGLLLRGESTDVEPGDYESEYSCISERRQQLHGCRHQSRLSQRAVSL